MSKQVGDALRLFVITIIAGCALGGIYMVTKEPIAAQNLKIQQDAYKAVLPEAKEFELIDGEEYKEENIAGTFKEFLVGDPENYTDDDIEGVVVGVAEGEYLGLVITVNAHDGYAGDIRYSVGVDKEGVYKGTSILEISETAGLGMRAKTDPSFLEQFNGVKVEKYTLVKDGTGSSSEDKIDAIGGSTVTSKSILRGINAALSVSRNIRESQLKTVGGVPIE